MGDEQIRMLGCADGFGTMRQGGLIVLQLDNRWFFAVSRG